MEHRKPSLSRRSFMGAAAGAGAAALIGGPLAASAAAHGRRHRPDRLVPRGRLGIQLYTVRDKQFSLGFAAVFEELARYGYEEVELFSYSQGAAGPITTAEIRQLLDDHGLRAVGKHSGYGSFLDNLEQELDDAETLGLRYIGTADNPGRYGNTVEGYRRAAEDFNTFGAAAKARGMTWYQHNHEHEFAFAEDDPSVRLYDVMLDETDPDLVFFEMDLFWGHVGQYNFSSRRDADGNLVVDPFDPMDYVLAHPERYPLFHIKGGVFDPDAPRGGYSFTDVGEGNLDYEKLIRAIEGARSHKRGRRGPRYHHYLVERDDAPNLQPDPPGSFRSAERGAKYLLGLREKH